MFTLEGKNSRYILSTSLPGGVCVYVFVCSFGLKYYIVPSLVFTYFQWNLLLLEDQVILGFST